MTRPLKVEISESQQELEKALKYATTASSKERLQMLYLLKSSQLSSRRSLTLTKHYKSTPTYTISRNN